MTTRAPAGLGTAGRKLWHEITQPYALDAGELRALEAAARTLDELRGLEDALADGPAMVTGSRGQQRPNPLYAELRAHRLTFARLMAAVALPGAPAAAMERSSAARRLALLRHHGAA